MKTAPVLVLISLGFCLQLPLEVNNWPDVARTGDPVTAGVPLPQGAVTDITKLRITDGSGNTVPAQFKWLSKWWWEKNQGLTQDPSLKWVLCDFQADVAAKNKAAFTLRDDNAGSPPLTALSVTDASDKITVLTGPLRFTVSKTHFNLLDEVWLDSDPLVAAGNGSGGFITAGDWAGGGCVSGTVHRSSLNAPDTVYIQEQGPVKVLIRVEGRHFAPSNGVSQGLYGYQVFITAYAGKAYVDVQWAVTNLYLEGAGTSSFTRYVWPFKSYDLKFAFHLSGAQNYALYTDQETTGALSGSVDLLQQQAGFAVAGGATGTRAKGMAAVTNGTMGVMFGMRDFAFSSPKGLRLVADTLVFKAFPDTGAGAYCLDAASRKNHRMRFEFFKGAYQPGMLLDFYKRMDAPLRMLAPVQWYASTRSFYPRGFGPVPAADWGRKAPSAWVCSRPDSGDGWSGMGNNWLSWGCWDSRFSSPGDHWNMNSATMYPYLSTGDPIIFEVGERRVWWFNDFSKIHYGAKRESELSDRSMAFITTPRAYAGIQTTQNAFPGYAPNTSDNLTPPSSHMPQRQELDYYLVTGDPMTYEALLDMGHLAGEYNLDFTYGNPWGWPYRGWDYCKPRVNLDTMTFGAAARHMARPATVALETYEVTGDSLPFLYIATLGAYSLRNYLRWTPSACGGLSIPAPSDAAGQWWEAHHPGEPCPIGTGASDFQQAIVNECLYGYWQSTHDDKIYDALMLSGLGMDWRMAKEPANTGFVYYAWWDYGHEGKRYSDVGMDGGLWSTSGEAYSGYVFGYQLSGRPQLWPITSLHARIDLWTYGYAGIFNPYGIPDYRQFNVYDAAYKHDSLDAAPPSAVADLAVVKLGAGQYRLNWTAPGDDGANGTAARYRVKYSVSPIVDFITRWDSLTPYGTSEFGWPDLRKPYPYTAMDYFNKAWTYQREQEIPFWAIPNTLPGAPAPQAAGASETFTVSGMPEGADLYFSLVSLDEEDNVSDLSNVVSNIPIVTATRVKGETSIEARLSTQLTAVFSYSGGGSDSSSQGVYFRSLDPGIAMATWYGRVTATESTGIARIEIRRGLAAVDTVNVTVGASTAVLDSLVVGKIGNTILGGLTNKQSCDSMKMLAGDAYPLHVLNAFWKRDTIVFLREWPDSAYAWSSTNPSVATVDKFGMVTGVSAGSASIVVGLNGVTDTVKFTIWQRPSFIRRINFQVSTNPYGFGWLADNGSVFDAARGYGWLSASGLSTREQVGSDTSLLYSYAETGASPERYRVDAPAGTYIIRAAIGNRFWGIDARNWLAFGAETLATKAAGTANTIKDDTVTVTGDSGIILTLQGAICYLVVISSEGVPISLVADDGRPTLLPPGVDAEKAVLCPEIITQLSALAYPNPFNPEVTIAYAIPAGTDAEYRIFDMAGRVMAVWSLEGGRYGRRGEARWSGRDTNNRNVASGLYIGRLLTGSGQVLFQKLLLVR